MVNQFDPSGRPGAAEIRERQQRIRQHRRNRRAYPLRGIDPRRRAEERFASFRQRHGVFGQSGGADYPTTKAGRGRVGRGLRQAADPYLRIRAALDERAEGYSYKRALGTYSRTPEGLWRGVAPLELRPGYREYTRLGGWWATANEDEERDWNAYSKAWHRAHGPKVTITNRRVIFARYQGSAIERRVVPVAGWRGHWLLNAAVEAGIVEAHKGLPHVRLHPAYGADLVRTVRGHKLYRRTLAGEFVDYCITTPLGMTYHAPVERSGL